MADHAMNIEEQEMEAEALGAIFDAHFHIESSEVPFAWRVDLYPEAVDDDGNDADEDAKNWVGISLLLSLPPEYPESALPEITQVKIIKGLTPDHAKELKKLGEEEAVNNEGVPSVFTICERLREWLLDHNQKGLDDVSMHAQMMLRKKTEKQKEEQQKNMEYESQKENSEFTEAERIDLEIRRRRAEGTPCTAENFTVWKANFEKEMEEKKEEERQASEASAGRAKSKAPAKDDKKAGRLTGYQQFTGASLNISALEEAAEQAEGEEIEDEGDNDVSEEREEEEEKLLSQVNAELFDVDDDDDLDDMDFDDDDE